MLRNAGYFLGLVLAFGAVGCGSTVQEKQIEVKVTSDPLLMPRSILQRYAEGQPLGSETTSFPKMVEDVKAVDPAKADILEKGLVAMPKKRSARITSCCRSSSSRPCMTKANQIHRIGAGPMAP